MYASLGRYITVFKRKREEGNVSSKENVSVVERRRHPRIGLQLPLDCSRVNRGGREKIYNGMVANVSEGGVLVYLPQAMEVGALLKTEIIFLKELELNTIKALAKVVWLDSVSNERWGKYRCGLQFQSFRQGDTHKLEILLKRWRKFYGKVADRLRG
ncbi:MAG: PilZ domain-containing protein [Thermodesulfobacteriota bacterium]